MEALARRVREYAAHADFALVEGAGGLLSPLTWEQSAVESRERSKRAFFSSRLTDSGRSATR